MNEYPRFIELRKRIFKLIEEILREDPCCKSYEGIMEIGFRYGDYFEEYSEEPETVIITLHCYLLGNGRHHTYQGKNLGDALDKLEQDIEEWERNEGTED